MLGRDDEPTADWRAANQAKVGTFSIILLYTRSTS